MVPDESRKAAPTGSELVSSFQILELVGEALQQISDGADTSVVTRSIAATRERFEKCEGVLERLPGGSLTRKDQLAETRRLGEELERKRALVGRYAEHDLVARVLAEKAVPGKEDGAMEDDADVSEDADDVMMKMDEEGFGDVEGMDKDVAEDVLMGLDI